MPLTDTRIKSQKPAEKVQNISDGGGLYVHVTRQGSKLWRMAYRFGGKQKTLSFGAYPAVSLSSARDKRDEAKRLLAAGTDPAHHTRLEKIERQIAGANSFRALAREFLDKNEREGKSAATLRKKRWLLEFACSHLGRRPIADITAAEILVPLREVEAQGNYETARQGGPPSVRYSGMPSPRRGPTTIRPSDCAVR